MEVWEGVQLSRLLSPIPSNQLKTGPEWKAIRQLAADTLSSLESLDRN